MERLKPGSLPTRVERRVSHWCDLLSATGAGSFSLHEGASIRDGDPGCLLPGVALRGGAEPHRNEAVARVLRELIRADQEIESLSSEILARYEEVSLVYRITERLGGMLGSTSISRGVLEDAAQVLDARRAELWLDEDGERRLVSSVPDAGNRWTATLNGLARKSWDQGRPHLDEGSATRPSTVVVPLPGRAKEPLGVLVLEGRRDGHAYRTGDVKLLNALATVTSALIHNDRLAQAARRAEVRRREDEIASEVYRSLLPERGPEFPGLDFAAACRPAERIGGDFFGYFPTAEEGLAVVLADVSGHGVGAGLYMAAVRGMLQVQCPRAQSASALMALLNDSLSTDFAPAEWFATSIVARFDRHAGRLSFTNAGHHPPILLRAGGRLDTLDGGGPALGVLARSEYAESEVDFAPGDLLLLYTDGLVEARDATGAMYGLDRLVDVLVETRGAPAPTVRDVVLGDLSRHLGSSVAEDDVTLIAVRGVGGLR